MLLLVFLTILLTTSCAATSDLCGSLSRFRPDPGFEERWTRSEKEQAVAHNRKLDEFCR